MQAEERQKHIEEYLQRVEFASLDDLARQLGVSVSTVRRDVTALETTGSIRRTHGGARLVNPRSDEFVFSMRDTHQVEEKEAIGKACAELITPGQSVIIDAGTTVFHVAKHIESKRPQIFTNSLPVANLYASSSQVEVVLSGGVIYPRLGVLVGPLAVQTFSKSHADVAVMSCSGITPEGLSNSHALLIEIQLAMINAAQRVIMCLDHTKFARKSLTPLCELDRVHAIVTDDATPSDQIELYRSKGMEVIVAKRS
jgi:DeoR/GlpR family transcriptional regulator of sugar metabolism